jgi:two-component system OmpR family response regulator
MLEGELANVGLSTLLTILDMERRSGVVTLQRAGGSGLLHVRDGRVVRASVEGARLPRAGREAIFELLSWTDGRFELWPGGQEPVADEVGESTTHLLLEAARRADEAAGGAVERSAGSTAVRAAALAW